MANMVEDLVTVNAKIFLTSLLHFGLACERLGNLQSHLGKNIDDRYFMHAKIRFFFWGNLVPRAFCHIGTFTLRGTLEQQN